MIDDGAFPVPNYPDLAGKVAVVTGGSQGIGAAVCRMLVANQVKVVVVARSMATLQESVAQLLEVGGDAVGLTGDATSADDLHRVRIETEKAFGPTDILIPFAGGFSAFSPIWETPVEEWREVVEANLTSTYLTMSEFLPGMMERRRGSIVTMASISGRVLDKLVTASYAAAKAGVVMLTRHSAIELGPYGVRVNAVAPGTISTERVERIMDEEALSMTAGLSPLGRLGTPEDCASATLFLASDSARWITGVTLDVSGGRAML